MTFDGMHGQCIKTLCMDKYGCRSDAVNTVCGVSYFQTAKYLTGVGHVVHVGVASVTSHIHQHQEIARPHHKHADSKGR